MEDIAKMARYVPTKPKMLDFVHMRIQSAESAIRQDGAGYEYLKAMKAIDTGRDREDVLKSFIGLKDEIRQDVGERACDIVGLVKEVKTELDSRIRCDLLREVVPSMRIASELFVSNENNGKPISSEEMQSVLEENGKKSQIVSTRLCRHKIFPQTAKHLI